MCAKQSESPGAAEKKKAAPKDSLKHHTISSPGQHLGSISDPEPRLRVRRCSGTPSGEGAPSFPRTADALRADGRSRGTVDQHGLLVGPSVRLRPADDSPPCTVLPGLFPGLRPDLRNHEGTGFRLRLLLSFLLRLLMVRLDRRRTVRRVEPHLDLAARNERGDRVEDADTVVDQAPAADGQHLENAVPRTESVKRTRSRQKGCLRWPLPRWSCGWIGYRTCRTS